MKVFVAGATGRVGRLVIEELVAKGDPVVAGSRHPESIMENDQVESVAMDLHGSVDELADLIKGADAIIFTGGSRGKDLLQTDLNGAVKLMMAARQVSIDRFIMLSSAFSLDQDKWLTTPSLAAIMNYNIAKFFADRWLIDESGLNYTIIQAGVLTEEPATGLIAVNPGDAGENTIGDVAKVLVASLATPATEHQVIMIKNGDQPIAQALQQL